MKASPLDRAMQAFSAVSKESLQALGVSECAFILDSLPAAPELAGVRAQLARRLAAELQAPWIASGDLYEVFAALTALWQYDLTSVSGGQLAQAIQRLIASEAAIGGPYYSAGTLAIPANAQISLFMRLVAKPLPNIDGFISHVITEQQFEPTTVSTPVLLHLLARVSDSPELSRHVAAQRQSAVWQSLPHRAVALMILGDKLSPSEAAENLTQLCDAQLPTGFWPHEPLFAKTSGQPLAASALAIAALYRHHENQKPISSKGLEHRQNNIRQAGHRLFAAFGEPLRSAALELLDQICSADKNFEVTLLPQLFAEALNPPQLLTGEQSTMLGLASLCGWMAYTIYDDFLDAEGDPAKLPVANVAMRASIDCFRSALPDHNKFQQYVASAFAAMDEANAWEIANCRFTFADERLHIGTLPNYGDVDTLAARSFPHVLGPMAVLFIRAQPGAPVQTNAIESAFRHYLIARQLNDDLQDWPEDIRAGQASYVATAILHDLHIKPGTYRLPSLLLAMQKGFRQTTMPTICQCIMQHISQARHGFDKSRLLKSDSSIYILLDKLEISVQYSLDKRSKAGALYDCPRWNA